MPTVWNMLATMAVIALAPSAPGHSQSQQAAPRYAMPSTQMWDITAAHGEIYRVFVSYPEGEPPADGWPVLYVLDGNAIFAAFAETRRMLEGKDRGKAIIVGVGYPADKAYDTRRLSDFTAAMSQPVPAAQRKLAQYRTGNRDKFLDFLTGELRAEVGKRFRINPERQALFGHSLGGLFALHALYTRPAAFHAIIAASPSLWWNDQAMLTQERAFAARLAQGKIGRVSRLMVVAGAQEDSIVNTWDAEAFAKRIEPLSAYGLRSRFEIYEDEGHMTVPVRAVPGTLRFAFSWP